MAGRCCADDARCARAMKILVVGGGLVGLGTARALRQRLPDADLVLVDKEPTFGAHQSTHNSGVMHSGLYYKPGSARARLVRRGLGMMHEFCESHGVLHEQCGKLVVATGDDEVPRLQALFARGNENGLRGLQLLSAAEAREVEPHVNAVAAVRVPEEGIVDYRGVVDALVTDLTRDGVVTHANTAVRQLDRDGAGWRVLAGAHEYACDFLVTCG